MADVTFGTARDRTNNHHNKGELFYETDTGRLYFDVGAGVWLELGGAAIWREAAFAEVVGDGAASTYVATLAVPAGYTVFEMLVGSTVVWNPTTTATLSIGDADSATGYASAVDLTSSPVANTAGGYGLRILGLNGTYKYGKYYAAAGLVTATITVNDGGTHHGGASRLGVLLVRGDVGPAAVVHTA